MDAYLGFQIRMPHGKSVTRIKVSDNPEKAPGYPKKFSRNNKGGVPVSRDEFLQDLTDKWVGHMSEKPAYKQTYTADKVLALLSHLSNTLVQRQKSSYRGEDHYALCRKLIISSEERLRIGSKVHKETA